MMFQSSTRVYFIPSVVCVLDHPEHGVKDSEPLSHYSRSYYVNARDISDAIAIVREAERKVGATALEIDTPTEADERNLLPEVRLGTNRRGVKWKSGRAFFPPN